jgi:iron complex outermembrane receptor protein
VTHDLLQWKSVFQQSDHRKWQLQISAQRNQRGEFDSHRLFGQLPKELSNPELNFDLWNIASNLFLDHQLRNDIHGKIGVDFNYHNNITKRGGLIPNYVSINNAAFWTERWHRYELPIEIEAGIRYDYKWINVAIPRQDSDTESKLQQFDFQSFAGNVGAIYKFSEQSRLSFNVGNAWRAPNVNELFSYGVHHGTASFEKGDINLKTEVALNNNLSFEWKKEGKWNLQTSVYRNFIQNFIYLEPLKEPILTIRGAFPAFQYTQANARLTGFDALLEVILSKNLTLQSKLSIIRAKNMTQQNWLILMPADHFENSLRYTFVIKEKTKAYVGCAFQNILKQTRVPENQDYIAPPSAYSLWNGELGIRFEKMSISLQIHNLMNTAYRDYLNRFRYFTDDIGRNISLKVKKSF